jgi:hypothetical protein
MDYPDPPTQLQPSADKPDRLPAELGQPNGAIPLRSTPKHHRRTPAVNQRASLPLSSRDHTDRPPRKGTVMRTTETATITNWKYPVGRPPSDNVNAAAPVLAVVWCRSVGTSWTLELHQLDGGTAPGTVVDWISSGVPISQPVPDALAHELLAERGLQLFSDSSAGPCTHSRHRIGYVCEKR